MYKSFGKQIEQLANVSKFNFVCCSLKRQKEIEASNENLKFLLREMNTLMYTSLRAN